MTASEKLQQLIANDKLTNEQQDYIMYYNVSRVDDARDLSKNMLNYKISKTYGRWYQGELSKADIITTLYNLLKYSDSDYVTCDGYGGSVDLLDDDNLEDILEE